MYKNYYRRTPRGIKVILWVLSLQVIILTIWMANTLVNIQQEHIVVAPQTEQVLRDSVLEFIRKHEGLRLNPYRCPANKLTIGYGHVIQKT